MSLHHTMEASIRRDDAHLRAEFHQRYRFFRELADKHDVDARPVQNLHPDQMRCLLEIDSHHHHRHREQAHARAERELALEGRSELQDEFYRWTRVSPNSFEHSPPVPKLQPSPIKLWSARPSPGADRPSRHGPNPHDNPHPPPPSRHGAMWRPTSSRRTMSGNILKYRPFLGNV
eukprot:TRINITY_DN54787_c0_g1_i1.p1 TRINITY_DN54787_c0_g1~~TRINITY_DN54787_c0_g1_i1.p1  ORF type:complete len:175 (+),score=15.82 TRINITY_DN54787_c0_g1_i1:173-697(+)